MGYLNLTEEQLQSKPKNVVVKHLKQRLAALIARNVEIDEERKVYKETMSLVFDGEIGVVNVSESEIKRNKLNKKMKVKNII